MNKIFLVLLTGLILSISIHAAIAEEKTQKDANIKIPQYFQRLIDVPLLNNSGFIPDYIIDNALIPTGFFDDIKKNKNLSKMLEIRNKMIERKNGNNKRQNSQNLPTSSSQITQTLSDIKFTGNISHIWNKTIDSQAISYIQIVKDLDGDKLDDILTTIYRYDLVADRYYYTILAINGNKGNELWKEIFTGQRIWVYAYPTGDLNGDKNNDVLITIMNGSFTDQTTEVKIKNGKNGSTLWKKDFGTFVEIAGDIDGDNLNDIILNEIPIYSDLFSFHVLRGKDGTEIWNVACIDCGVAESIKDVDGDNLNDISVWDWCSACYPDDEWSIYISRGYDGNILWGDSAFSVYAYSAGDLNGDGKNDVLEWKYNLWNDDETLFARKGYDGTILWQKNYSYYSYVIAEPIKDINGDNLNDIMLMNKSWSSNSGGELEIRKGTDYSYLWGYVNNNVDTYFNAYPTGDLNGDRLNDIMIETASDYSQSRPEELIAKRGNDGYQFWNNNVEDKYGYGSKIIISKYVKDLDGDKLNDIVATIKTCYAEDCKSILEVMKGKNGQTLWKKEITDYSSSYLYPNIIDPYQSGDLDNDGLNDLILKINNNGYYAIMTTNGKNGNKIWRAESFIDIWFISNCDLNIGYYDLNGDRQNDTILGSYNNIYLVTKKLDKNDISVISPNGGENWIIRTNNTIRWNYTGNPDTYVNIELLKGGILNRTINSSIRIGNNGNGSYNWLIPSTQISGNDYKIRITSASNPTYNDTSNNSFTISLPINLLKNPGFETSDGIEPTHWDKFQTGTNATFTYPETGRIGGKSVAIKYTTKETGKVALWWQQSIPIIPSKQYKLSGYMKLQNVTGGITYPRYHGTSIRINWYRPDGGLIKVDMITKSGTTPWTKYEKTFTAPSNAVKATVGGDLFNSSGKVWFDDLSFTRVS